MRIETKREKEKERKKKEWIASIFHHLVMQSHIFIS
jgi:hypothetical protein